MPSIKNPYAEKDTSPFNIKIFNSYDTATKTGSLQIADASAFVIPGSAYGTGALSAISITADSYVVQEATTQRFMFTTQNEIPGTTGASGATDIEAGVHIHFPNSFRAAQTGAAGTAAVTGAGVTITGATATVDKTAFYDPLC